MPRPSHSLRVAPEFADLVRRFARYARAGNPRRVGNALAASPVITATIADYLARSPMNRPDFWAVPTAGDLLAALPPEVPSDA